MSVCFESVAAYLVAIAKHCAMLASVTAILEDGITGERFVYDINPNTNYSSAVQEVFLYFLRAIASVIPLPQPPPPPF